MMASQCNHTVNATVRHQILLAQGITASVSLAVCLVAVCLMCANKLHNMFTHRMALYVLLSASTMEIVFCFQTAMYSYDPTSLVYTALCKILGVTLEYSVWIMLLFMLVLVIHLGCLTILIEFRPIVLVGLRYRILISALSEPAQSTGSKARREAICLETSYVFIPLLFPLLFIWVPFIQDLYGLAGAWCWIRNDDDECHELEAGLIEQYALWYGPFFFLCSIISIVIVLIIFILCKRARQWRNTDSCYISMLKENMPLLVYPVIYQLFNLAAVIQRIHEALHGISYILLMLHAILPASWGFFFAAAYIMYLIVWKKSAEVHNTPHSESPLLRSATEESQVAT